MKKIASIILVLTFILGAMPVNAARGYRSAWVECEDSVTFISGKWNAVSDGNASQGKYLKLDCKDEIPHEVAVNFNLSYEDDYDIYILATPGNTNWTSARRWKLNDGEYEKDLAEFIGGAYVSGDGRGVPIGWYKLTSAHLEKGSNSISFYVDKLRTLASDMVLSYVDVVAVAPTSWNWIPDGLTVKPYNRSAVKMNVVSGKVSKKELDREESFNVEVSFRLGDKADAYPNLYAELALNGETVTRVKHIPTNPMKTWGIGVEQKESFDLKVPFNVPDGEYEVRAGVDGMNLENGEESAVIDKVTVGKGIAEVVPITAEFSSINIPDKIQKGEDITVSADFKLNKEIGRAAKPYVSLWKDGLLYEVLEGNTAIDEKSGAFSFNTKLTSDMPVGSYEAKVGIHYVHSDTENEKITIISGTDSVRSSYHKPMSYGHYYSKQTGREQFWYINQSCAAIWNGEPYIPIGGMAVLTYITGYRDGDDDGNKARFLQDVDDLEKIRASGVNDLYINPVAGGRVCPTWAWRYMLDYLEENDWYYGIQACIDLGGCEGEAYSPHATEQSGRYEVGNITESSEVTIAANNDKAISALYTVINDETKQVVDSGICDIVYDSNRDPMYRANVKLENNQKHTVYFTPKTNVSLVHAKNYWSNPQKDYDAIEKFASTLVLGDNFRLCVDVQGNEMGFYNDAEFVRFADKEFNDLFISWLKEKYLDISAINQEWKTTPELTSFEEAVELIPVYTSNKDENNNSYSIFVNSENGKSYTVDTHTGVAWNDYLDARDDTYLDFNNKSADAFKKYADVPVVYKHCSVQRRYFINKNEKGGFDGMGSETYGLTAKMPRAASMTGSLLDQMTRTGWQLITETNTEEGTTLKFESKEWSYPSEEDMFARFIGMLDAGAKGIYDFLLTDRYDEGGNLGLSYSWVTNPDTITWGGNLNAEVERKANIYANERAADDRFFIYPSYKNWWYNPTERSAVQLNDDTMKTSFLRANYGSGAHIAPTDSLDVDSRLIFVNIQDGPYSHIFGEAVSDMAKNMPPDKRLCIIGHRNDLGNMPEIDKYYTDEKVVIDESTNETVQILKPTETSEVLMSTSDGKPWALKDGELYIVASDKTIDENETGGYIKYADELGVTDVKKLSKVTGNTEHGEVGFSDMIGHWAENDVNYMKQKGIANGVGDNKFNPETEVTVAEYTALVTRIMGYTDEKNIDGISSDKWYCKAMAQANASGILTDEMKQNPEKDITREEIAYITSMALKKSEADFDLSSYSDSADISDNMKEAVKNVSSLGIMNGMDDDSFKPKDKASRAQAIVVLKRVLDIK